VLDRPGFKTRPGKARLPRWRRESAAFRWVVALAPASLFSATFLLAGGSGPGSSSSLETSVRAAAEATYIHGMTEEIALAEVGPEGLPVLRQLLGAPDFPRRDNVVAFMAFLGGAPETDELIRFLESPPASLEIPEEDRAFVLTPQVLGQIAFHGDRGALGTLLKMTDPGSADGLLTRAASHGRDPDRLRTDLLEAAMRGLAFSGAPEAVARLENLGRAAAPHARSAAGRALDLYEVLREGEASRDGNLDGAPGSAQSDIGTDNADWGFLDSQSVVHDTGLTYANHVALTDPMTDVRLDEVLGMASLRAGRGDDPDDVACCITVSRSGSARQFGTMNDGLDVIDDGPEMAAVMNDSTARVKVIRAINYCGGAGTNIIGCAWSPGNGMAVVRMSGLGHESVLWIHEYGHNASLSHSPNGSSYIMYMTNYGTNDNLTQVECDTFHNPHSFSGMTLQETGMCTDVDADLVHDGIDNCPDMLNHDQTDSDGNGVGDACGPATCGNGVREGSEECDGSDLGTATCQAFGYQSGFLSCDQCFFDLSNCSCMDLDADGHGDSAYGLGPCAEDCDDSNGDVWDIPGAVTDLCFASDPVSLEWTVPVGPGGVPESLTYDLIRSADPRDFSTGAVCVESDDGPDTTAVDPEMPSPGGSHFYLVRPANACPGSPAPMGSSRDARSCP